MRGKSDAVYRQLLQLARDLGPETRLPSIRTLCERFGVSQATIDSALARLERQHILQRRERSGVFVAPRLGRRNIAMVCDPAHLEFNSSPFWMQLLDQAKIRAETHDETLRLHFSRLDHSGDTHLEFVDGSPLDEELAQDIQGGSVQGVLAVGLPHEVARWVEAAGIPVVAFAGPSTYLVQSAIGEMIDMAVEQLMQQGCRRLTLFQPRSPFEPVLYDTFQDKCFQRSLAKRGMTPHDSIFIVGPTRRTNMEQGVEAVENRFSAKSDPLRWPDGIVCTDDMMTQGMLMAFQRRGIAVGRDVCVATHANVATPVLYAWEDRITRLEFDLSELVHTLFDTLEILMDGGTPPEDDSRLDLYDAEGNRPPEHIRLIRPHLVLPTALPADNSLVS